MRLSTVIAGFAILVAASGNAYAYLDPGTGSIILQAIVAAVASSLFVIRMYWYRLKSALGLSPREEDSEDEAGTSR